MKKRVLGLTMAMVTAISMTGCGGGGTTATTAAAKEYQYDKLDSGKKDPFAVFGHGSGHCAGALRHRPQSGQQGAETGWCRGDLADLFQRREPYYSHCDGHSGQGMGHLH